MKKQPTAQDQFTLISRNGQLVFSLNTEIMLPEEAPVRLTNEQLEELDYTKLYQAYSPKGRKSAVDARVLFKVMTYGYQCGIYSSRKLEEACKYRIDFIWLLEGNKAPDHATLARFRTGRCQEAAEELFYQFNSKLEQMEETDHCAVFIDGTKLESKAGRYTFVWKKTVQKHLDKVKAEVKKLSGLETKTELGQFLEATAENIDFVHGKGKRKSKEQRDWEKLNALLDRWEKYDEQLTIIGSDRNSCSKTDHDATFMRMKEDHMKNGQLKPGYNVQLAVNSEYITGVEVYPDRTDSRTLRPLLETLKRKHGHKYEEIVADAGYESLENYMYLEKNGNESFIKPLNYEQSRKKSFKRQIGRFENMSYNVEDDCYICAEGRKLVLCRECSELIDGQEVTNAWYRCEDCSNCPSRSACCRAKDPEQSKEIRIQRTFQKMRELSRTNITSERGIHLRVCRSIQVEGAFGVIKQDYGFRRFLTAGKVNVRTELFFLCLAYNLEKLWNKRKQNRLKTRVSQKLTM